MAKTPIPRSFVIAVIAILIVMSIPVVMTCLGSEVGHVQGR